MLYIHTVEYYSTITRNKIGSSVETWMEPESVIQSEVSQKVKQIYGESRKMAPMNLFAGQE